MKTRLLITMAAAAIVLAGCSKEENEPIVDNWNGEIRLSSGVTVQTRANNVPDTQIASGQTVQVVVSKQAADTETYAGYDQPITAQGDGTFAAPTTAMYYPQSGQGVSIYAYHPSTAAASFVTNIDQSTDANYFNSDLLYSATKDYDRQPATHSLTFTHQLSKLTYELASGEGSPTIAGATIEWKNVCNTAAFDKATGAVSSPTNPVTIIPHATYGTIIVPQTVNSGTAMMTVTLASGGVLTYKPAANQLFEGSKKYHYKITVDLTGLTVTSSITDWEAVTERTGNAAM